METNLLFKALYNAYGSKKNFEREIISYAFKLHYKGSIYLKMDHLLNLKLDSNVSDNEYTLLKIDLETSDIYNFIEELDYSILANTYNKIHRLVKS